MRHPKSTLASPLLSAEIDHKKLELAMAAHAKLMGGFKANDSGNAAQIMRDHVKRTANSLPRPCAKAVW